MRAFIGGAALALLLAGCGDDSTVNGSANLSAPIAQIAAPNGNWTEMVSETPEGGFRMGNPNAPVKLVEYGSLGCHVCADFSTQGSEPLREKYVKSGQVSWEFRPYILFPSDPGISMLLRCQGPAPFFQLSDQLYADQPQWMAKLQAAARAMEPQLEAMTPHQRAAAFVQMAELDEFFRMRGISQTQIDACLADTKGLDHLLAVTERGNSEGVQGTPTFFINGRRVENAVNWALLEPQLRAAIG
jgi:protein-disulfide isomerase